MTELFPVLTTVHSSLAIAEETCGASDMFRLKVSVSVMVVRVMKDRSWTAIIYLAVLVGFPVAVFSLEHPTLMLFTLIAGWLET